MRGPALNLLGTKMTDAGPKELAGPNGVEWLDLGYTKVTGAGLKELAGLKSLKTLYLSDETVTAPGVAELTKAVPGLRVLTAARP